MHPLRRKQSNAKKFCVAYEKHEIRHAISLLHKVVHNEVKSMRKIFPEHVERIGYKSCLQNCGWENLDRSPGEFTYSLQ